MSFDVVVVGGGITGLVAARSLSRAGARVGLLERSPSMGGMVSTIPEDGYLVESGPDSFLAAKDSVLRLADELGIGDEVIRARPEAGTSHVWWDGGLHPLPGGMLLMVPYRLRPFLGSSLLSWRGKARVLGDLLMPRGAAQDDESLESFVRRRLGDEVLQRIAQPLVAGIHAAEPGSMSLRASFPRFLEMERRHRSLILAARAAARSGSGGGGHFATFTSGMGRLVDSLVSDMAGVEIRGGATAVRIQTGGHAGYRVGIDGGTSWSASAVILATPALVTSRLLDDLAPGTAALLRSIHQVPGATVTLAYRDDHLPRNPGTGFVVPAAQGQPITGVTYSSRKWEGRTPDPEHALVRVFIGRRALSESGGDRDALTAVAVEAMGAMAGVTAPPLRSWVTHREAGLHSYTLGHIDRIREAERQLGRHPGLVIAGAGFHGIGLNECIDSGERAAALVSSGLTDGVRVSSGEDH